VRAHPRIRGGLALRFVSLVFGLFLFALAIVLTLESRLGLWPWDVLHQGIARHTPLSFGAAHTGGPAHFAIAVARAMIPVEEWTRSLGTIRWMPLETRRLIMPRPPTIAWISSVHTPVQLSTACASTSVSAPVSQSRTRTPQIRSASRRKPMTWLELRTTAPY